MKATVEKPNPYLYQSLAVLAAEMGLIAESRKWFMKGTQTLVVSQGLGLVNGTQTLVVSQRVRVRADTRQPTRLAANWPFRKRQWPPIATFEGPAKLLSS